jgi:hypothetical protein
MSNCVDYLVHLIIDPKGERRAGKVATRNSVYFVPKKWRV